MNKVHELKGKGKLAVWEDIDGPDEPTKFWVQVQVLRDANGKIVKVRSGICQIDAEDEARDALALLTDEVPVFGEWDYNYEGEWMEADVAFAAKVGVA